MAKQILYLTYDGLTDALGRSQIIPYMIRLSKTGFKISIISFEKKDQLTNDQGEIEVIMREHAIRWIHHSYTKKPPVLSTLWDILKLRRTVASLISRGEVDLIHCRSYITALVGLAMKRRSAVRFLFDMRGFWADERVEGGLWNRSNPVFGLIYRYFKRKELEFLSKADHVITLTENARKEILSWKWGCRVPAISVIPTCVDLDLFNPELVDQSKAKDLRKKVGASDNTFVLMYVGSIGTWYMVNEMLEFFSVLQAKRPDSRFVFVTKDNPKPIIESCKELGVPPDKVNIMSSSHDQIPTFIASCDWAIFFIKPVYSKMASMPTKFAEIAAMNKPIVCNTGIGDLNRLFQDYSLGICIDHFGRANFELVISKLLDDDRPVVDRQVLKQFALDDGVNKLMEIYNALIG